ncbi:MAG: cytochrome c biogenesis protein CcsA [Planctomycetota bacterium]
MREEIDKALAGLALAAIAGASLYVLVRQIRGKGASPERARVWLAPAFGALSYVFASRWAALGYFPVANVREAAVLFIWALLGVYLFLDLTQGLRVLLPFLLPAAALAVPALVAGPGAEIRRTEHLRDPSIVIHILAMVIAYAAYCASFGAAITYLAVDRGLKRKEARALELDAPPLQKTEGLIYACVWVGSAALSAGILAGAFFAAERAKPQALALDPKVILTGFTWCAYALVLSLRHLGGMRGRKLAILTAVMFIAVLATSLGVEFVLPGRHATALPEVFLSR